ncbi:hypothetical protein BOTCAL_1332g00020 [Botryotinia calthae]|uniref:ATPase AAA-type core domain-containing protein n=1 Tax=Botryotinia calthae TaxID=38488 RepID=A0A4Y8CCF8_9HELO|nr:hypothetical protein BOTCAL_1332g00020 [Botryotinia calthae]
MDENVKETIVHKFDTFYSEKNGDKKLYEELGFKHKLVYLLHGESGTGKTSLITALAHHYRFNLYWVNLQKQDEGDLKMISQRSPEPSIIVFEDIKPSTFREYKAESNEGFPLRQGKKFGKLLDGLEVRYSVVQKYLLNWIRDSKGAFDHAEEWLENLLGEKSDKTKTQNSEISHGPTMMDDINTLKKTGQLNDSVMVDKSSMATDDKQVDESKMVDDVKMVDESNSLSDGKVGTESRLVDDTRMAGEIKVVDETD